MTLNYDCRHRCKTLAEVYWEISGLLDFSVFLNDEWFYSLPQTKILVHCCMYSWLHDVEHDTTYANCKE